MIDNRTRAKNAELALDVMQFCGSANDIIAAYEERSGEHDTFDTQEELVVSLLSDTLHAIAFAQNPEEVNDRTIRPDELDLEIFEELAELLAATFDEGPDFQDLLIERAYRAFIEQQT